MNSGKKLDFLVIGNNLNYGHYLNECLKSLGYNSKLVQFADDHMQDSQSWFQSEPNSELVQYIGLKPKLGIPYSINSLKILVRLYKCARNSNYVIMSQDSPSLLLFGKFKRILLSLGSDLQIYPLRPKLFFYNRDMNFFKKILSFAIYAPIYKQLFRFSLNRMDLVFCQPYQKTLAVRFCSKSVIKTLPLPLFRDMNNGRQLESLSEKYWFSEKWKLIVFSPTRIRFDEIYGEYGKGNQIMIDGFADFFHTYSQEFTSKVLLVLTEKGNTKEIASLKKYIKHTGLPDENILWISEKRNYEIQEIFKDPRLIIADQFKIPSLGNIGREALFHGKLLITSVNQDFFDLYKTRPPGIYGCSTSEDISRALFKICDLGVEDRKNLENGNRTWSIDNLDQVICVNRMLEVIQEELGV